MNEDNPIFQFVWYAVIVAGIVVGLLDLLIWRP
jgi:hypothetical protein